MRKKIKTIPTLVGLIVLLAGIVTGVLFIREAPSWLLRASPEMTPKQVVITNISDTTFTVSWITDSEATGFINYGEAGNLSFNSRDDRDQLSGKVDSFSTHHVTVKGLKASTAYSFKIGSGRSVYDNNGQVYEVTTGPALVPSDQLSDVAHGNILDKNGNPAEGVIVYLTLADATKQSTLTKSSGTWVIPLTTARTVDLNAFVSYDKDASIEEIFTQGGKEGIATAITLTKKDNPVPTITLGGNFDFRDSSTPEDNSTLDLTPTPTSIIETEMESSLPLNNSGTPSAAALKTKLEIINPTQSEKINTQSPEIIGKGPAGQTLTITVHSPQTFTDTITINNDGSWDWTPPTDLEPGEHTVTVTLDSGQKVSKTFTILAKGLSAYPAIIATPSGEISVSPIPTSSPTPTIRPIATRTAMPVTNSAELTPSGITTPTILVLTLSLIFIFLGILTAKKISLFM